MSLAFKLLAWKSLLQDALLPDFVSALRLQSSTVLHFDLELCFTVLPLQRVLYGVCKFLSAAVFQDCIDDDGIMVQTAHLFDNYSEAWPLKIESLQVQAQVVVVALIEAVIT